jgi:hypothetical protein
LKLAKITKCRYNDDFWAPDLDGDCKNVEDCGDYLEVDYNGDYECDRTDGHASESSRCTCEDCDQRVHEDDIRSIGYPGDRHVGECCIGDYVMVSGCGGNEYYLYQNDAIEVDGEWYDPDYLDRYDIIQLDDGDYVHQDDAVYLEQREIWVLSDDDCAVWCEFSSTYEHIDDCVELADGDWALENDAWQCDHDKKWYLCDEVTAFDTDCGLTVHPDHAHAYITIKEEN